MLHNTRWQTHTSIATAQKDRFLLFHGLAALCIIAVGSLMHFAFAWSGHHLVMAVFAPVNESVWEHGKMAIWPGFCFALLAGLLLRDRRQLWLTSQFLGLMCMPLTMIALFYAYTAILGDNYLAADITVFFVSIITGQALSYALCLHPAIAKRFTFLSRMAMVLLLLACGVFTFFPPSVSLFEHAGSGLHGIIEL